MNILNESLDYLDMIDQVKPLMSIDEYAAKMGSDSDIVTLSFIVNSRLVAEDIVRWFEKGYDFVLDASVSDGEISPGKFLVFVEVERRSKLPERIMLLLSDMETLTEISPEQWKLLIDKKEYPASEEIIKDRVILNPNLYRAEKEGQNELNEMRVKAGLDSKPIYKSNDKEIRDFISLARL